MFEWYTSCLKRLGCFLVLWCVCCSPIQDHDPALEYLDVETLPPLPQVPLHLGTCPEDATDAQREAMWWVNTYRARAGLKPIDQLITLNDAANSHANFVGQHPQIYGSGNVSVHQQVAGYDGFSGEWFWERLDKFGYTGHAFREVIAFQAHPESAVAHWMESLYHRLPLLHPAADHLGYGEYLDDNFQVNVLDIGSGDQPEPTIPSGIAWPANGAYGVPVSWDGLEEPQPPSPPGGYPSGPVVTLTFASDTKINIEVHKLRDMTSKGAEIAHTFVSPDNDPQLQGNSSVAMYANKPLAAGHQYQVTLSGTANAGQFNRVWSFVTRPSEGCKPLAQDCNIGKACYGSTLTKPVCKWVGRRLDGDVCDYQNDCAKGLTCVGTTCRPYCGPKLSGSIGCDALCPSAYSVLKDGELAVCSDS